MLCVECNGEVVRLDTVKTYAGVEIERYAFLTSAICAGDLSASRAGRFASEEVKVGTRSIRCWVASRASLNALDKAQIYFL
jgi:hypothetical protein